jgi:WD40 repeat protein
MAKSPVTYRTLGLLLFLACLLAGSFKRWPGALILRAQQAAAAPTYAGQVLPILQQKCLACHSGAAKMGGLVMASYDTLMKGGAHGREIVPGKSEESRLVLMLEGKIGPRMPFGGDPLPLANMALIKAWIDAGAKGPAPGEATAPAPKLVIPDIKPQVTVVSPVLSLGFSPDGRLLAAGGYKEVRLMEAASGKVLATLPGHADYVRSIAFSPDGKWLAAGGGPCQVSGEIKLWDVEARKLIRTMAGHSDCIYSLAVSPDGKLVATTSYDKLAKLWDASTGKEVRNLKDHIDAVFAAAFSPDGKWLATGSQDRSVKIWDVASGQRLYTLSEPLDGITSIAFAPSGKQIAAGGYDKTIYVWNLTDKGGTLAHTLIADEDAILQIAWSPDGKTIITSSSDGSIRVRDANSLDPISVLANQPDWVEALSISPNGKWLAAGRYDGTFSVYDLGNYKQVLGPQVAFEPHQPPGRQSERQAASR